MGNEHRHTRTLGRAANFHGRTGGFFAHNEESKCWLNEGLAADLHRSFALDLFGCEGVVGESQWRREAWAGIQEFAA